MQNAKYKMQNEKVRKKRGFTTIELLVAISIIALLITGASVLWERLYGRYSKDIRIVAALKDMEEIKETIVKAYYPDLGSILCPDDDPVTAVACLCMKGCDEEEIDEHIYIYEYTKWGQTYSCECVEYEKLSSNCRIFLSLFLGELTPDKTNCCNQQGGTPENKKGILKKKITDARLIWNKYYARGRRRLYIDSNATYDATYFNPGKYPPDKEGNHVYLPALVTPWADRCEEMAREIGQEGEEAEAYEVCKEAWKKAGKGTPTLEECVIEYQKGKYYQILKPEKTNGWEVPKNIACILCCGADGLDQTSYMWEECEKACTNFGEEECLAQEQNCKAGCAEVYQECLKDYDLCKAEEDKCLEEYEARLQDYNDCINECRQTPEYQNCISNCKSVEECCHERSVQRCREICKWPVNCGNECGCAEDDDPCCNNCSCYQRFLDACINCHGRRPSCSIAYKCKDCCRDGGNSRRWYWKKRWKYGKWKYGNYGCRRYRRYGCAFCYPCDCQKCIETGVFKYHNGYRYVEYDCEGPYRDCLAACRDAHCSDCVTIWEECEDIKERCDRMKTNCDNIKGECSRAKRSCKQACSSELNKCRKELPNICRADCLQRLMITDTNDPDYIDIGDDMLLFVFGVGVRSPLEKKR